MKNYLLETFRYNDFVNRQLLKKMAELPVQTACIRLFSHMINSQYKWMARILHEASASHMSWWDPVYDFNLLEEEWVKSLKLWTDYISSIDDEILHSEVQFSGYDGAQWAATPLDIALQLNYHSIHHRAQIQTIIRQQGFEPDFVDYIGTKYRRLG